MAPLDRTVALAERDAVALAVEQHLDLDVARPDDKALEDEPVVTECDRGLAPGSCEGLREASRLPDRAHPLAATTGGGFHQQREADPLGGREDGPVRLIGIVIAREDGHAE